MRKIIFTLLLLLVFLLFVFTLYAVFNQGCIYKVNILSILTSYRSGVDFRAGQIIVKFQDDVEEKEARNIIHSFSLTPTNTSFELLLPRINPRTKPDWVLFGVLVEVPQSTELDQICRLRRHPRIEYVTTNPIGHIF